jgi:hypothetical protein
VFRLGAPSSRAIILAPAPVSNTPRRHNLSALTAEPAAHVLSPDQTGTGITHVHSASDKVSPFEGTAYNTW